MNQEHLKAVMLVKMMESLRPLKLSTLDAANRILVTHGKDEMVSSDFTNVLKSIELTSFSVKGDKIKIKNKRSTMNNEQMFESLGDNIVVLFHSAILNKKKVNIEIRFNVNGKIELMNGNLSTNNLSAISREYANEYGMGENGSTADISKVAWKVSPSHHPEIEGKRGLTLKQYIEKYC